MTKSEVSPIRNFFAVMLIGIGVLMMLLCGGCGTVFFISFIASLTSSNHADPAMVLFPIILGGVPALIGFLLYLSGRRLRRSATPYRKTVP